MRVRKCITTLIIIVLFFFIILMLNKHNSKRLNKKSTKISYKIYMKQRGIERTKGWCSATLCSIIIRIIRLLPSKDDFV